MLPGKKFTPEDILKILRRRFWLVAVPVALVAAGTALYARRLPDVYRAQAVIQIVPQRVPENYVKSTVTTRIEDRLQSIREQILSRSHLEQIIQRLDLYRDERRVGIMENIVDQMRNSIRIDVNRGADSFTVSFTGHDARTVAKVTEQLATLFIDASLRDREVLAEGTDQFLQAQLEEARRRLIDQEKKLEAYRMKYSGQLPDQVTSNLQSVSNVQLQIQMLAEADNRDSDRRLTIERALKDLESEPLSNESGAASGGAAGTPNGPPLATTAATLAAAKKTLASMLEKYSEAWPDVVAQKRYVNEMQRKLDAEALQTPVSSTAAPVSPADATRQKRMRVMQDQLTEIDRQMAARTAEVKRLRTSSTLLQQRVDALPARQSELVELTRDYSTLSSIYTSLLAKLEDAKISSNLERRQIGEQFKLLDPARVPERPFSPDRGKLNLYGLAAGLAIGLALVALLEYRDSSFTTDDEVTSLLALPVLAVVPMMLSEHDRRRAKRRRWLVRGGLGGAVAACLVLVVYTLMR